MKVMFLGNSHTYYQDMPEIFKRICKEKGKDVEVTMFTHPGMDYKWHLKELTEVRFALMHGGFDYVIFQQAAHPGPPAEETYRDAKILIEMAKGFGVTPIQTLPWCEKYDPAHQAVMYEIYEKVAKENDVKLNPIGRIFEDVTKNHPEIEMYWRDGEHASPYGAYANALSTFAVIFGESIDYVSSNSIDTFQTTDEQWEAIQECYRRSEAAPDNKELRRLAVESWDVYTPLLMNKDAINVVLDEDKAAVIRETVAKYAL